MDRPNSRSTYRRRPAPRPESPRSIAAQILNRLETSTKLLDEVMAVEFANRDDLDSARRHRTRLLVGEVVKRRATLDQLLKVFSTRDPNDMENHVRTVLRLALAEWFFVAPPPSRGERRARADRAEVGADENDAYGSADPATRDYDRDREQDARDDVGRDRAGRRPSRFARDRRERDGRGRTTEEDDRPAFKPGDVPPVARGPIAAAVVNLVGTGRPSRGFVNGVLRAIDRETRYVADGSAPAKPSLRDSFPAQGGGVYRFRRTLFADPERKPATWLAQSQSLPKWLTERFLARYGQQGALEVAQACNAVPALSVRVNTRVTSPDTMREAMQQAGIQAHETPLPEVLRIEPHVPLTATYFFEEGQIYLQDLTAARTVHMVELSPGMRILDGCAAPGGKITHACERLNGQGSFFALDISRRRLRLLQENLDRLGHTEIQAIHGDLRELAEAGMAKFDVVFVDAPCTNTGVLARRLDARWRVGNEMQQNLIKLQVELLRAASKLLAPGGRLVYSTCTLEPEENRGVVVQGDLELEHDSLWLPESGICDGGYQAVLRAP